MRHVITVVIDRPIAEVWTFSNDVFNAPRLGGLSLAFRQTSKGPMELGSTFEGRVMILGFETRMTGAITEWDPPHASTATFAVRPLRSASIRETLETVAEGTRFDESDRVRVATGLPAALAAAGTLRGPAHGHQRGAHETDAGIRAPRAES